VNLDGKLVKTIVASSGKGSVDGEAFPNAKSYPATIHANKYR
jgi:hypothetical protein